MGCPYIGTINTLNITFQYFSNETFLHETKMFHAKMFHADLFQTKKFHIFEKFNHRI